MHKSHNSSKHLNKVIESIQIMELRYRGQPYSQFPQQVPTIPSKKTLCYRGCKYNPHEPMVINQPQTSDSQMSAVFLKYRRVSYALVHFYFPTKPEKTLVRY